MNSRNRDLTAWGWNAWFEQKVDGEAAEAVARVAAVDREQLLLVDGEGFFRAKLAGRYLYRHRLHAEMPCVGDWVLLEKSSKDGLGVVHAVLERRTSLYRKSAGNAVERQMIAANVDVMVVVQSCHADFNVRRLERYLVMALEGGAAPLVLLTKSDLVESTVLSAQVEAIRAAGIIAPTLPLSNVTRDGVEAFERLLQPGKTYCFVGSSGVGKSTLINRLIGHELLDTGAVSETGEGRHTTVRRELVRLGSGALVIDNPGMREFGVLEAEEGLAGRFDDIEALASGCRYRDCSHTGEPGCAVRAAAASGEISQASVDSFLKLRAESEFNQMSYAEKRKKDRTFGRYVKSVKKDLGLD